MGKIKDFLRGNVKKSVGNEQKESTWSLLDFLGVSDTPKKAMSEATYFACMKILAESVGKLPLKLQRTTEFGVIQAKNNPMYRAIRYRPNPYMNAAIFWGTMENCRNHFGNAYAYINGYGTSNPTLWIMEPDSVEMWYDDGKILSEVPDIWYIYTSPINGKRYKFSSEQVLHLKTSTTFDGLIGKSVRRQLADTVQGGAKSQAMLNTMYDNGFTARAVLKYTGTMNDENTKKLAKGVETFAVGKDKNIKSIIPIPVGTDLVPLDIKLTDAQFIEIRKYTALQIAAAFGIKPNQINDYEKSSYASAEAQQLAFYVDTLLYILKQYEEELNYKLLSSEELDSGYAFKFNVATILRADTKTQLESISNAVANGVYTPNEGRAYLDMPAKPGGEKLYFNGSNIPITLAGTQYGAAAEKIRR